jgi:hypothetical protein
MCDSALGDDIRLMMMRCLYIEITQVLSFLISFNPIVAIAKRKDTHTSHLYLQKLNSFIGMKLNV